MQAKEPGAHPRLAADPRISAGPLRGNALAVRFRVLVASVKDMPPGNARRRRAIDACRDVFHGKLL